MTEPLAPLPPALAPRALLAAYAAGIFPMAECRDDPAVHWVHPRRRGVLPLADFHVSRSLARTILRAPLNVAVDEDFAGVVEGCADRPETWINASIRAAYLALFRAGHAHSLEVREGGRLVGGVFGVTLGGAFFGESMFSRRTDASKVALAYLVDRLRRAGFALFDTQFLTPHLARLGGVEIDRDDYRRRLRRALGLEADFAAPGPVPDPQSMMQRMSQRS